LHGYAANPSWLPKSVRGWSGRVRHRLRSSTEAQARLGMRAYLSWLAHECAGLVR